MLRTLVNRRVLTAAAVVAGLLVMALWPQAVVVEIAETTRGPLVVTIDEEGRTRVRERFVVSSPLAGRVLRIELEPGDQVKRGDVVARVRAEAPPLLDERSRAEAAAAVESARAALGQTRAEAQRAQTALMQADRELARVRALQEGGLTTPREVDLREAEAAAAKEASEAAGFAVRVAESELTRAEARLVPLSSDTLGRVATVRAPADGVVLRRLRESESVVPAGEPLLEIGDPARLEIVADLLSTDAVQVAPGARAVIEQWGGSRELAARVRLVEPSGFTKISALGVEEQRVNVILDFVDPADGWGQLGDGYRVEVRIVVWEAPDVLKVPTGALFRESERWAVYIVEDGRARLRHLELGRQNGQEAEVASGLEAGDRVILHPGDTLADGGRVETLTPPTRSGVPAGAGQDDLADAGARLKETVRLGGAIERERPGDHRPQPSGLELLQEQLHARRQLPLLAPEPPQVQAEDAPITIHQRERPERRHLE
jgi:HlyD family secretion protein